MSSPSLLGAAQGRSDDRVGSGGSAHAGRVCRVARLKDAEEGVALVKSAENEVVRMKATKGKDKTGGGGGGRKPLALADADHERKDSEGGEGGFDRGAGSSCGAGIWISARPTELLVATAWAASAA